MEMNIKEIIARRVAQEINDGDVINLGIGIPTLVAGFLPESYDVSFQSENGFFGLVGLAQEHEIDKDLVNAGGVPAKIKKGAAFFDSSTSFSLIRGGHVDATVLGSLQVDQYGNLANWKVPGKMVPGMGGAMDLVVGAKKVIVAMQHDQKGTHKILEECTLPLTAKGQVNMIITELAAIEVTPKGLVVLELGPNATKEEVIEKTGAKLTFVDNIQRYNFG